jgi:hypothetical protein
MTPSHTQALVSQCKKIVWLIPYLPKKRTRKAIGLLLRQITLDLLAANCRDQPIRRRERKMQRFRSAGSTQLFLSVHSSICNHFNIQRHLISRNTLRQFRDAAATEWCNAGRAVQVLVTIEFAALKRC